MNNEVFACFIMTYERPNILRETIKRILGQTFPPAKIMVIDNGESFDAEKVVLSFDNPKLEYFRVGYNAGPAGASKIGLERLVKDGFDYIYWCDDDDPPRFQDTLEVLVKSAIENPDISIMGAVGQNFNAKVGVVERIADGVLYSNGKNVIDVDVIAGNMCIIVHRRVVEGGVLPNPLFFLNVEEYDFCLRAKEAGFRIGVPADLFLRYRSESGTIGKSIRPTITHPKTIDVWRRYYSTRNLIFVLYHNKRCFRGALIATIRAIAKAFYYLFVRKAPSMENFRMEMLGVYHGWVGKMGKRVLPVPKY